MVEDNSCPGDAFVYCRNVAWKAVHVRIMALYANIHFFEDGGLFTRKFFIIKVLKNNSYQLCSNEGLGIPMKCPKSKD